MRKLTAQEREWIEGLLRASYKAFEDAKKEIIFYSRQLGIEPKDLGIPRKKRISLIAVEAVMRAPGGEMRYADLIRSLADGGATEANPKGGPTAAIKQAVNKCIKIGYLSQNREFVKITPKGIEFCRAKAA